MSMSSLKSYQLGALTHKILHCQSLDVCKKITFVNKFCFVQIDGEGRRTTGFKEMYEGIFILGILLPLITSKQHFFDAIGGTLRHFKD